MRHAEERRLCKYVLQIWLLLAAAQAQEEQQQAAAAGDMTLLGDASVAGDALLLTSGNLRSVGRAMHSQSFRLCSNASFNTSFSFSIENSTDSRGDGMAFVISGSSAAAAPPENSFGKWLGLFNEDNKEPSNRLVAVEFDSVLNPEIHDPNDNHVGLDVNSIASAASMTMENEHANGVSLHVPGKKIYVWIDYDGEAKSFSVTINRDVQKPSVPVLDSNTDTDLCATVGENAAVGFSASSGNSSRDVHRVHSWEFSSRAVSFSYPTFSAISSSPNKPGANSSKSSSSSSSDSRSSGSRSKVIILVMVPLLVIVLLATAAISFVIWRRRRVSEQGKVLRGNLQQNMPNRPLELAYRDVRQATNSFNAGNVLGQGGFGTVYFGTLAGSRVAVKRISEDSQQGEKEFLAEILIISRLSHRNLVPLRGWCCRSKELLLVYEYMPHGSLDKALFSDQLVLDWKKRYEIVCGLASALCYLHEECEQRVVHRDVKPSNVLLDSEYNAKLGDFGLARLVDRNKDSRTTTVAGTMGYLAPEINRTGKSSTLTDVYSFGIVVLEVACGRRPFDGSIEEPILVEWVWQLYQRGRLLEAADAKLSGDFDKLQMTSVLVLGLACSSPQPSSRPAMSQVINMLRGDAPLPDLLCPGDAQYRSLQFF